MDLGHTSINVSGLTKRFGTYLAVDSLDLLVERGQTFGFLGPNGAGKSTTIRMLLGLVKPTSGCASLLGYDIVRERLSAVAQVGSMVEVPSFYGYLTGRENARLFGLLSGKINEKEITSTLDIVGLGSRGDDKVKTYSHGMRQRLGIACALLPRPELVILDEPTNGLDPQGVMEVRRLVQSLSGEHGMTVFLSSHLLHEVEQICSHVAIIARGKRLAQGPVTQLLNRGFGPVEFAVDRPSEAAANLRASLGAIVLWENEERLAVNVEHAKVADYNQLLVQKGFRVNAIEHRRQSLEDYYLQLMHGDEEGLRS